MMKKICTHSGIFHADESLAIYLLKLLPEFRDSQIVRSRSPEIWEECDIVVDVGAKYDKLKFFDHHQKDFNVTFNDDFKTKLSSAGLIYKHFGKQIIKVILDYKEENKEIEILYPKIYKDFIEAIDANDNGISNYPHNTKKLYNDFNISLPSIINKLNKRSLINVQEENADAQFEVSVNLIGSLFVNLVKDYGHYWLPSKEIVERAFNSRFQLDPSGQIMLLEKHCDWKEHLYEIEKNNDKQGEIKFVLNNEFKNNWRVITVPSEPGSFNFRVGLPEELRGLRDDELSKKSKIDDCIFIHSTGFIGGSKTKDSVLKLAQLSLSRNKN